MLYLIISSIIRISKLFNTNHELYYVWQTCNLGNECTVNVDTLFYLLTSGTGLQLFQLFGPY